MQKQLSWLVFLIGFFGAMKYVNKSNLLGIKVSPQWLIFNVFIFGIVKSVLLEWASFFRYYLNVSIKILQIISLDLWELPSKISLKVSSSLSVGNFLSLFFFFFRRKSFSKVQIHAIMAFTHCLSTATSVYLYWSNYSVKAINQKEIIILNYLIILLK